MASTRRTSRKIRSQIWLPREGIIAWKVKVNSEDVTVDVFTASFFKALCPDIGQFKVELINADSFYSEKYEQGQDVELFIDFGTGTTKRFKGKIDSLKNALKGDVGFSMMVEGGHGFLFDKTVTKTFSGTLIGDILEDITTNFLGDPYTVNSVITSSDTPIINWNNKPFWDCVNDLCRLAGADAYLDESDVIQFFDKNSIENNGEAIVWNDTLIDSTGLGKQSITTKNKVIVYGDDGTGLPVISTKNDILSQDSFGVKEQVIFDTKIDNTTSADEVATAELSLQSNPETEGDVLADTLPSLQPGEKVWITNPTMKINGQYKIFSLLHKFPVQETSCTVFKRRKTQQLFKKRIEKELAAQTITNPFNMTGTVNMKFDDESEIATKDVNVEVSSGKVNITSGSTGTFFSVITSTEDVVESVHLQVIGSKVLGTVFEVSTDGGNTFETVNLSAETVLTNPGKSLVIKVTLNSTDTELDSISMGFK